MGSIILRLMPSIGKNYYSRPKKKNIRGWYYRTIINISSIVIINNIYIYNEGKKFGFGESMFLNGHLPGDTELNQTERESQ